MSTEPLPVTEFLEPETQPARVRIRPRWYVISVVLFVITAVSTTFCGSLAVTEEMIRQYGVQRAQLYAGMQYSFAVMGILLCHELGHYLQALRYRIPAVPPLFIPMPFSPFGTMGAVIVQQAGLGNRRQQFDIGISGPLAGLVATMPALYFGLQDAKFAPIDPRHTYYGDPLILTWMLEWINGPKPPGTDVMLTPILYAGWVGVFITALNLFPFGQLDGGHILYGLLGKRAHLVAQAVFYGAVAWMLTTRSYDYLAMLLLVAFMGLKHPPTADDSISLGWSRTILGWATLSFLFVGFVPTPIVFPESGPAQPVAPQPPPAVFPDRPLQPDERLIQRLNLAPRVSSPQAFPVVPFAAS